MKLNWEQTEHEELVFIGDVGVYYREGEKHSSSRAVVTFQAGPHYVEVERQVMTKEEIEQWAPKAAVLVRQFVADLEKLRFVQGEDSDG